jgi:hypothetical protein
MPPDRVSFVEHRARFGVEQGIDRGSGQIRPFDRNERRAGIAIHLDSGLENRLPRHKLLALFNRVTGANASCSSDVGRDAGAAEDFALLRERDLTVVGRPFVLVIGRSRWTKAECRLGIAGNGDAAQLLDVVSVTRDEHARDLAFCGRKLDSDDLLRDGERIRGNSFGRRRSLRLRERRRGDSGGQRLER